MTLAAILVGAAYNALDEYETMMTTKTTPLPPMVPRKFDLDYQRYFGRAMAKIATAEAALMNAADQHMELCRRFVDEGIPYSYADDHRIGCIAREVMIQAWETMQSDIFRTAGSSAGGKGQRIERIYRDMSIGATATATRCCATGPFARSRAPSSASRAATSRTSSTTRVSRRMTGIRSRGFLSRKPLKSGRWSCASSSSLTTSARVGTRPCMFHCSAAPDVIRSAQCAQLSPRARGTMEVVDVPASPGPGPGGGTGTSRGGRDLRLGLPLLSR